MLFRSEMKKKEAVGDFSTRSKWILVGVNQDAAILEPYFFLPYKMNEVYCDESRLGLIVRFEEDKSIMSLAMLKANRLGDKTKSRFLWGSVSGDGENPSAPVTSPLVRVTTPVRVLKLDTPEAVNPATRFSSFPIAARMVSEADTVPASEVFRPASTVLRTLALVK